MEDKLHWVSSHESSWCKKIQTQTKPAWNQGKSTLEFQHSSLSRENLLLLGLVSCCIVSETRSINICCPWRMNSFTCSLLIFLTDRVNLSKYNSACISTGQGVKARQIAITLNNQNLLRAMAIQQACQPQCSASKGERWCKRCLNHFNSSTVSSSVPNNLPWWQRFRIKRKRLRARRASKKSCHVLCACMRACVRNKLYYALRMVYHIWRVKHAAAAWVTFCRKAVSMEPSIVVALQRVSHVHPIHYRQEALDEEAARVAFVGLTCSVTGQPVLYDTLCVCD